MRCKCIQSLFLSEKERCLPVLLSVMILMSLDDSVAQIGCGDLENWKCYKGRVELQVKLKFNTKSSSSASSSESEFGNYFLDSES